MEELTVTIYQDRYEQLLDIETRVNVLEKFMSEAEFVSDKDIRTILGFKPSLKKGTVDE